MKDIAVGSDQWLELVTIGAKSIQIEIDRQMAEKLAVHANELVLWNRRINLTAIVDPYEIAVKHVLDSAAAAPLIHDRAFVLDIGSGGGFPGIVLKIIRPDISLVLVDASRKKVSFLKHVIRLLSLKNIEAIHERTTTMNSNEEHRGKYDVVTCRAFSSLKDFAAEAESFIKEAGMMIAYKGKEAENEIQDLVSAGKKGKLKYFSAEIRSFSLPQLNLGRSLIILRNSL